MERGRRLDVAWEACAPSLGARDRRWVHEAVYGTTRLRGRLDHLLDIHLHRGLKSVPLPLLRVLRLGAYQVLYMRSVPSYAAVSQSAAQGAIVGGSKGAALVNAVLRALARTGAEKSSFPDFREDPVGHLATWGSHPRWLVERWVSRFGERRAQEIADSGNRMPAVFFRPFGMSPTEALAVAHEHGHELAEGPAGSGTLRLLTNADPSSVLAAVPGTIQDPAAARTALFVGVEPGDRVADLCAAPGGKGIALSDAGGRVVGLDPSLGRLLRMKESLARLGIAERLIVARGEAPPIRAVDRVLVDAPCTGTATLSRHPDARWRLTPESPARMSEVQSRILDGASAVVRVGGHVIYATCTLESEENEGVVERFLRTHPEFVPDEPDSRLSILPSSDAGDGAFAARLRRLR